MIKTIFEWIKCALSKRITLRECWDWFKSFFSEEDGASTTRMLNWLWCLTLCFVVIFGTIKSGGHLPDLNAYYVSITTAFLGAKVGQRIFGEKSTPINPITTTPPVDPMLPADQQPTKPV
jgi:hypothetical protein